MVHQNLDHLPLPEHLVFHTSPALLGNPEGGHHTPLRSEKPGIRRGVWERVRTSTESRSESRSNR